MRTILYSTERVTANNLETFAFILFLLVWAIAASYYVLKHGLADPDRDRFKLILNCIMILTSVVPPELPMELTIAVNASLVALARKKVFCTEPFRIPMAGKVTTCCFDKTGTLTSDHMVLEGVAGTGQDPTQLVPEVRSLPSAVARVLACCQSLVQVDGSLVGDPVETASIEAIGWKVNGDTVSGATGTGRESAVIMHRFHFSSALKRMSTVARMDSAAEGTSHWVLSKGAPEVIGARLAEMPDHYERCYKKYAAEGARVLALAVKKLPQDFTPSTMRHTPRDEMESGLDFVGFAVFRSPIKPDSEPALRMLRASRHQLIMITGDAPLTACHTAAQVHIVTRQPLILAAVGAPATWQWRSPDETLTEPFSLDPGAARVLADAYDLCLTGDALQKLSEADPRAVPTYVPLTSVFARVTPEQKELVVKTLRSEGLTTLMCGDGTNDVGALKGAHVGVALLPPAEKKPHADSGDAHANGKATPAGMKGPGRKAPHGGRGQGRSGAASGAVVPGAPGAPPAPIGKGAQMLEDMRRRGLTVTPFHERMAKMMDDMAQAQDMGEVRCCSYS